MSTYSDMSSNISGEIDEPRAMMLKDLAAELRRLHNKNDSLRRQNKEFAIAHTKQKRKLGELEDENISLLETLIRQKLTQQIGKLP